MLCLRLMDGWVWQGAAHALGPSRSPVRGKRGRPRRRPTALYADRGYG